LGYSCPVACVAGRQSILFESLQPLQLCPHTYTGTSTHTSAAAMTQLTNTHFSSHYSGALARTKLYLQTTLKTANKTRPNEPHLLLFTHILLFNTFSTVHIFIRLLLIQPATLADKSMFSAVFREFYVVLVVVTSKEQLSRCDSLGNYKSEYAGRVTN
jgi:hypothetical protein